MTDFSNPASDDRLSAYLDGELTAAESIEIEYLLKSRSDYREALHALRSLRESLRSLPRDSVTVGFAARVVDAVASDKYAIDPSRSATAHRAPQDIRLPTRSPRFQTWLTRSVVGAAILAIAATLVLIVWNPRPPESPQIAQRASAKSTDKKNESFRAEPEAGEMAKASVARKDIEPQPNPAPADIQRGAADAAPDNFAMKAAEAGSPQDASDASTNEPFVTDNETPLAVVEGRRVEKSSLEPLSGALASVTEIEIDAPMTWADLELRVFGKQPRPDSNLASERLLGREYAIESVVACEIEGPASEVDAALSRLTTQKQEADRVADSASALRIAEAAPSLTPAELGENLHLKRIAYDDPRVAAYVAGDKSDRRAILENDGSTGMLELEAIDNHSPSPSQDGVRDNLAKSDSDLARKRVIIVFRVQSPAVRSGEP